MFVFNKGKDVVRMDDNKISTSISMKINKLENSYLVHIPSFNIHFYTKYENEIDDSAHESLVSFFNYWLKEQGIDKLHSQMLSLGFTIKNATFKQSNIKKGETKLITDELVIA
jgi:hypothetical protein